MKNKKKNIQPGQVHIQLPKDAISRIKLGQAFAEYDRILMEPGVFVMTPSTEAALNPSMSKCFFIGRRGTGKTAITKYISEKYHTAIEIHPQVLSPMLFPLDPESLSDPRQRPFRSLAEAFKRAIQDEVLLEWVKRKLIDIDQLPSILAREVKRVKELDFDLRILEFLESICKPLTAKDESKWLQQIGRSKQLAKTMLEVAKDSSFDFTLLIDRIDDSWDGSDTAVIMLMALMHACIEVQTSVRCVRPLLFLRENVFDRVRQIDKESTRLETCVVSMDWTHELLLEMIERRLSLPFITKLAIGGPTWDHFFEKTASESSESLIFEYCQKRPRDILTYCSFALEIAQSKAHEQVTIQDIMDARRRFSETRLKDLGDEYAENFPQIAHVLSRFYGLGHEFTITGIEDFIKKLLSDKRIQAHCSSWIYGFTQPEQFVSLLYNIGFVGIKTTSETQFRSLGPSSSSPPPVSSETHIVIHPSYNDALDLRPAIITNLEKDLSWQTVGLLTDLPEAIDLDTYIGRLDSLAEELKTLPDGKKHATKWEDVVGDIIKLCFFKWLSNVEPRNRDVDGCVIRDWIASNRAKTGFWNMIFHKYGATQIIWECKNYSDLQASDFQQISYYINSNIGKFGLIAFRGEVQKHYYEHIKRIANEKEGLVLLLTNRDLEVFVRQAKNGKTSEGHIQDKFDTTIRMIS